MNLVKGYATSDSARRLAMLGTLAAAVVLVACGDKGKSATQVAAKVNKEEISVHQINFALQRQPNIKPEQMPAVSARVLESLIDQELALQQAQEQKLDREPRVVMAIEAARRDIIARAYADKLADTAAKPTDAEIHQYYAAKPGLFAQRRIYTLVEFVVEADAALQGALAPKLQSAKTVDDLNALFTAAGARYNSRRVTQSPENLPLAVVDQLAGLADGQHLQQATPTGLTVLHVVGTKSAPVTEEQAKGAVGVFLLNEQKRKLVENGIKALRKDAKIQYLGQFAQGGSTAPAAAEGPPAASALNANEVQKGISGLK